MKTIAYAYATSDIAHQINDGAGCYYVEQSNPACLHGPFLTVQAAEEFCERELDWMDWGFWSVRLNPADMLCNSVTIKTA